MKTDKCWKAEGGLVQFNLCPLSGSRGPTADCKSNRSQRFYPAVIFPNTLQTDLNRRASVTCLWLFSPNKLKLVFLNLILAKRVKSKKKDKITLKSDETLLKHLVNDSSKTVQVCSTAHRLSEHMHYICACCTLVLELLCATFSLALDSSC